MLDSLPTLQQGPLARCPNHSSQRQQRLTEGKRRRLEDHAGSVFLDSLPGPQQFTLTPAPRLVAAAMSRMTHSGRTLSVLGHAACASSQSHHIENTAEAEQTLRLAPRPNTRLPTEEVALQGGDGTDALQETPGAQETEPDEPVQMRDAAAASPLEWHEMIVQMILQIHMRVQPPGLQRVTMGQLREADKVLFTKISEETRARCPSVTYPFEVSLAKWKDHTQVQYHLVPVASGRSSSSTDHPKDSDSKRKTPPSIPEPTKKSQKASVKTNDRAKDGKTWQVPDGCHSRDKAGKPICFAYNQKGCSFAKAGKRCRRGRRICWRCLGEDHAAVQCPEFQ